MLRKTKLSSWNTADTARGYLKQCICFLKNEKRLKLEVKDKRQEIINRIFAKQGEDDFWIVIPKSHKYYPNYIHYVPNFRATLWTLILLADLQLTPKDARIKKPLQAMKDQFFDEEFGIYSLKEDHFPIPCLNGNMIYLDCYFNGGPDERSLKVLEFFNKYQRFDDGCYVDEKNEFCSNKSCYGKHSCYWGITKLLKGISFIPKKKRTPGINKLAKRCIDFVLLHQVCYSSHKEDRIMIKGIDKLTFPNMYKSDFLEILWTLKRERVRSDRLDKAVELLKLKQEAHGAWNLERKVNNMVISVGQVGRPNMFITNRAIEVLDFYNKS